MEFEVYLGRCYMLAQTVSVGKRYSEAKKEYERKKKAGYKHLRKPRRPQMPFNKVYFDAINK